ncbi:translation elongation factor Ts [candidate division KSB1 bacterium]|nr:translation elongation factor Ts [candidate division KSB1 bacterium]
MSISAADVKKLRDQTGAGMMDCKNALKETDGDIEKAIDALRKKGIASAQKRSGRAANEGLIMSYIHPGSRLGVMVEVNCETDFVAKTDDFSALAKDIAMQIAASNPVAIKREEVPTEEIDKEMDIFRSQAKNAGKPEAVIEKIVLGKIEKYYQEIVLLEQPFVKDTNKSVKEYLLEVSSKLGEALNVKRFVRFQLGEE